MTLEKRWPLIYENLLDVKDILEKHYRNVVDFEFVVERGKLYILGAREAKSNIIASLIFALQFFQEGKISLGEAIARVDPEYLSYIIESEFVNKAELTFLGSGIPASIGIATGKIMTSINDAEALAASGKDVILLRIEVKPEDIYAIHAANGVLTTRGGKTSHAAVVCCGMGKPCVTGFELIDINYEQKQAIFLDKIVFNEGDWITIDGHDGSVYAGKGEISLKHWTNYPELVLLYQMIDCAITTGKLLSSNMGNAWRIRDFFLHSIPISRRYSIKKAVKRTHYKSFLPPKETKVNRLRNKLIKIANSEHANYSSMLMGLSDALYRIISSSLGIGNHHLFFRPLWDPEAHVNKREGALTIQFVGFEYFDINRYIPYLIEFSDIRFLMEIKISSEEESWFLDFTNPNGESLVVNSHSFRSYCLFVNGAIVDHNDFPVFYNFIRRREYYWQWYETKKTSHEEIIAFLKGSKSERILNRRLCLYCAELGLLKNGELTNTGLHLIEKKKRSKSL